ncbi:T9SS type A sorting domain-containing protein [Pontibacter sp. G13]|uniref:T9SS type A sorting domain-containing protein n=1 Tax=Pontibacter sp. G13 TaxID=3074898 RepID=UPI00288A4866|nr:T9SS type A sorting domain-containing protein [Pontibacter sp. G13]WNJ18495.1 T9SS type A sorting domain-containing protein [Pontibacter sp. G13]
MNRLARNTVGLLLLLCLWLPSRGATVWPVSSLADAGAGTLRSQLQSAQDGDTLKFTLPGTVLLDSVIYINKDVAVVGFGPDQTILDGQGSSRIFYCEDSTDVYVSGIHFTRGVLLPEEIFQGGGAISTRNKLTVVNCLFSENEAEYGGAIFGEGFNQRQVEIDILHSAFIHNKARRTTSEDVSRSGGAIFVDSREGGSAALTIENATFSGNEADLAGGAIFLIGDPAGGASLDGTNLTIAYNHAYRGGGIDNSQAESIRLANSIVALNTSDIDLDDIYGSFKSQGNNLIGDTTAFVGQAPYLLPTDIGQVNPGLAPLGNNGSILPTHALTCSSPAIDAGNDTKASLLDLRGQARVGTSDIGSHERNEVIDLQITTVADRNLGSLRQALILACPGDTLSMSQIFGTIWIDRTLEIDQDVVLLGNPQQGVKIQTDSAIRLMHVAPEVTATLAYLTLEGGDPSLFGGGAIQNQGHLTAFNSSFIRNRAESGGAIANYGVNAPATLNLTNCTFGENEAEFLDGGAIDNRSLGFPAATEIEHCTFVNNTAGNNGGALFANNPGEVTISNSLFSGNFSNLGRAMNAQVVSNGHNLVSDTTGSGFQPVAGDIVQTNASIDPLGDYGGPTVTYRLQSGSPAIDAGSNAGISELDQRGYLRIFNGISDIGAYEYDPATSLDLLPATAFSLYPNPARDYLMVKSEGMSLDMAQWELSNLLGQQIWSVQQPLGNQRIALPDLTPGVYLLTIRTDSATWTGKFLAE